ncbi:MAG: hypothetical protein AB7O24_25975 [Kofleriaceae bacterium]
MAPDAIRVAILGELFDEAEAILQQDRATSGVRELLRGELALHRGRREVAIGHLRQACQPLPAAVALWCYTMHGALHDRSTTSPAIAKLRDTADAILRDLELPGEARPVSDAVAVTDLTALDGELGNALARAFYAVDQTCSKLSVADEALATVALSSRPGRPSRVRAMSRTARLDRCIIEVLAATELPAIRPTDDNIVIAKIYLHPESPSPVSEPSRIENGGLGFAALRSDGESFVLGGTALIDVGRAADFRFCLKPELELGSAASTIRYAARAMLGFGLRPGARTSILVLGGAGVSRLSPQAPRGIEVPLEARLRLVVRDRPLHAWLRMTHIFDQPARQRSDGSALLDADEVSVGVGARFTLPLVTLFYSLEWTSRATSDELMVLAGVPIGDYF